MIILLWTPLPNPGMLASEEVDVHAACQQPEMAHSSSTERRGDRAD
jgi:hypothetical protein